jgi:hypothetical protein
VVTRALARAQKKAEEEQATIIWVDEAGFYLLPMAVRTWAPRGHTPVLRVKLTRDHLSAISGITLDGRLFLQVRRASYDSTAVVAFLRVLLRKVRGKIVLSLRWLPDPSRARDQGLSAAEGRRNVCSWSNSQGMHLISIQLKASGITSSALSWAMSAVRISMTCLLSSFAPENVCATNERSFVVVHDNVGTRFSFLSRDQ